MFRDARRADLPEFIQLWTDFIEELAQVGGEFVADEGTLRDVRNLFDAYVSGALDGLVVLYEPPGEGLQGVGFIGETRGDAAIRDSRFGKMAHTWGLYIRPAHRKKKIGYHLQMNIGRKLKTLGFDTVGATILDDNNIAKLAALGSGMKPHATVWRCVLEEWTHG